MFEGFTRTEIKTSGARIVTVHGGKGPPLLLLHGNPFSHLSWHKIAPRLASEFTVVATDLRGYGDSEKPPGGADPNNVVYEVAQIRFPVWISDQHDIVVSNLEFRYNDPDDHRDEECGSKRSP